MVRLATVLYLGLAVTVSVVDAKCRTVMRKPVMDVEEGWKWNMGEVTAHWATMSVLGAKNAETAYVSFAVGGRFPIHRHLGHEEVLFFLSGEGTLTLWGEGDAGPVTHVVKANSTAYIPAYAIHDVVNTATDKSLDFIAFLPVKQMLVEHYDAWPSSPDAAGQPVTYPWYDACPPGQEDKDEL